MPTLKESISIAVPIKQAYTFLADIERVQEWLPRVLEAQRTSEIQSGEGAELAIVMDAGGRKAEGTSQCIEATLPSRLVFESRLAIGLTSLMAFDLVSQGRQQTQVAVIVDYTFNGRGLGRLLGGLFGEGVARRDIAAALENLKAKIEAQKPRAARKPAAKR